ncbi:hypothetical protein INR77_07710 [Erythrobacter sp. SCSIO 43205]|uniref:hypothetical protein n=1 Tax=Erythrobacter sp. SCSIO 43205 TaxID=2779361 RepID=UPI001CA7E05E|nr:hypothetical protein [Erythrobacter sp. SCSIO 43205]UAB79531.1 hypothetical protein INR77_07710 [Erythrobacter sp. SCSIO 43205]
MTARMCQYIIALVFLGLGGWALIFPSNVIEIGLTPDYSEDTFIMRFVMACFGAQAVMFGIMALIVTWSSRAFAVFAAVLIPFFVFNYYFHYELPVLTSLGMLDFAGNVIMFIACIVGWRAARTEEQQKGSIVGL